MLTIKYHSSFKKDYKRIVKRGYDIKQFEKVLNILVNKESLPQIYRDHELSGNWKGCRECHIQPDWLLIYKIENDVLTLTLFRTGTHSDLFDK
ncbi:MAG: type II toxin-antitoxin system YafQ family toxin [Oscillospiraceae bacterium]|nr:type II toxin-antitoxin system YafQ family toxin [Oscillospiraceae bacterium]